MSYLRQCFGHLLSAGNFKTRRQSPSPLRLAVAGFSLSVVGLALAVYLGAPPSRSAARQQRQTSAAPASPQSTVQAFTNTGPITINDDANAAPYPSNITVSGINPALVTDVRVALNGFSHTFPDDVDVILVGPQGQRAVLMSDAGGGNPGVTNLNLTFSQTAATAIPDETAPTTGTFRPANYVGLGGLTDTFPAPGPGALTDAPADLSVFDLTNPNGTWSLYVVDDEGGGTGSISIGWTLFLTVPQIFTVNSVADTSDNICDVSHCTLREAITFAQDGDLINFGALFNTPQTINLLTALPNIDNSITVQGKGANLLTVRRDYNAATDFRIFNIPSGVANGVAISGMTIAGGRAIGLTGGGIRSFSNLTLTGVHVTGNQACVGGGVGLAQADGTFTGCTFSGNQVDAGCPGGGIYYGGDGGHTLRVVNSTVSGNRSAGAGGGIVNSSSNGNSRLEVVSSTIANNTAAGPGGIYTRALDPGTTATTTLRNSIIAGNTPNNLFTTSLNGTAAIISQGFNLASDNSDTILNQTGDQNNATPRLGPLSLGGGTTPTHALLGGSPALDAGDASGLTTDQRGVARVFNNTTIPNASDGADIGAVEMQSLIVTSTADSGTGSLRNILSLADSNPSLTDIIFDPAVFDTAQTITLTSGELPINSNVTINGAGANLLTVSGNNQSRVFYISPGFTVSLNGMTITGGNGVGATLTGFGGGILSEGNLTISDSAISGNATASGNGGGICSNGGIFNLVRSTVSGNTAAFRGGGLTLQNGNATLTNSTISGNTANIATNAGGGVFFISLGGIFTLQATNCTIANNTTGTPNTGSGIVTLGQNAGASATVLLRDTIIANNSLPNLRTATFSGGAAAITSQGFNLANDDGGDFLNPMGITTDKINTPAGLAALANNGGTMPTHALLSGSAALDAGNNSGSGTLTDQRGVGFNRTVDIAGITDVADGTDIGAYEAQTCQATLTLTPPSASFPANVGTGTPSLTGTINVGLPAGCDWTAVSNDSFITITAGASGAGDGTVTYQVAPNPDPTRRTGTLTIAGHTFTVVQGIPFLDVPLNHPFYSFIGKLSARAVTLGCGNGNYCPDANVTREQMAIFIERALGVFTPPTPSGQTFQDVPPGLLGYPFIEDFVTRGITLGCAAGPPRLYCPTGNVTRDQMAIFIERALGVFTPPPGPATATFGDVPNSGATDFSYEFIEDFVLRGITQGCAAGPPRLYCPTAPVTRGQMAVFLVRAFGL
jgi:CSLREA domain-containing protein